MNFSSTLVKAIKHDRNMCTFRNGVLALILKNNKALKIISGQANMITVTLL